MGTVFQKNKKFSKTYIVLTAENINFSKSHRRHCNLILLCKENYHNSVLWSHQGILFSRITNTSYKITQFTMSLINITNIVSWESYIPSTMRFLSIIMRRLIVIDSNVLSEAK